jgi:cephalosporin-C deacetylase
MAAGTRQNVAVPTIDLPLQQLRNYTPEPSEPADFEQFWERTISAARKVPLDIELGPPATKLAGVRAHQVRFSGLGGARISGWYVRPQGPGPFPGVAHYHGYGGRGPRPLELYPLAAQGVATLSMDCRGQAGDAADIPPEDGGHYAGWLTRGLAGPETYYYRYVFTDAVRALDALASLDEVDGERLAVTGVSQGGGLALAVAALSGRASFVWSDIPFLCDFPRAVAVATQAPYTELPQFLRTHPELNDVAFQTLAYFDVANHAPRLTCPAYVTVGLLDETCPPSTIFGTFARVASSEKELVVLPYHGHDLTYEVGERRLQELVSRLSP